MDVSVIIPCFNRAQTIGRAIESVISQTYQACEIIVIDDGSTDSTLSVLESYSPQVKIISQKNSGPSAARNRGAAIAVGEIVAFLDSDDVWLPTKLELQVRLLKAAGPEVPCCVCNTEFHGAKGAAKNSFAAAGMDIGNRIGYLRNPEEIIATRFFIFNQVLAVRKAAFEQIGGFNEKLWILEDSDLALRMARLGPWAIIGSSLVVKYEDTEGIGVTASKDLLRHAQAWKEVIERLSSDDVGGEKDGRWFRRLARRDVNSQITALQLAIQPQWQQRILGKLWLMALRLRRALWRRSSWWPKVEIFSSPTATGRAEASKP